MASNTLSFPEIISKPIKSVCAIVIPFYNLIIRFFTDNPPMVDDVLVCLMDTACHAQKDFLKTGKRFTEGSPKSEDHEISMLLKQGINLSSEDMLLPA